MQTTPATNTLLADEKSNPMLQRTKTSERIDMIMGMVKPSPNHSGNQVLTEVASVRQARIGKGVSQKALAVDAKLERSYVCGNKREKHIGRCST